MSTLNMQLATERRKRWLSFLEFAERHGSAHWLFRGVADARTHLLVPKIGRFPKRYNPAVERLLFANFKRRANQFLPVVGLTDWDLLALAQHHGLPTRLLDWTKNPLVAAYFATTSSPTNTAARIYAYQASDVAECEISNPFDLTEVVAFFPAAVAPRIISQRGVFTVHPEPIKALEIPKDTHVFDISADHRPYFQRRLFDLAVDPSHIQADLDGICSALDWQYQRGVALGRFSF